MALNSQLLTVQILTNDVQVFILCLSYFITNVQIQSEPPKVTYLAPFKLAQAKKNICLKFRPAKICCLELLVKSIPKFYLDKALLVDGKAAIIANFGLGSKVQFKL